MEGYHRDLLAVGEEKAAQDGGAVKSIHDVVRVKQSYTGKPAYDTLPRSSLIDRFLNHWVTLEEFENNEFQECGDFSGRPYELSSVVGGKKLDILLKRTGEISGGPGSTSIVLEKRITLAVNSGPFSAASGILTCSAAGIMKAPTTALQAGSLRTSASTRAGKSMAFSNYRLATPTWTLKWNCGSTAS